MKTYVSYGRTVSRNYQGQRADFGFEVEVKVGGARVTRAYKLCKAMVNAQLGEKIGMKRSELDELAQDFFDCSWMELSTGVAEGDEVI